jgi:hypothetical protein
MRFFPKGARGCAWAVGSPRPLTLLPQLPDLLLNALAPVPALLATDKPVGSALESVSADNAVPFRRRMLGAVASSTLRIDLIAVPLPPIPSSFTRTLAAATPTAGIHAAIGRERFQG